jgi:hypothetical protein
VRRIVLVLVLVAVVGIAGFLLLRPKGKATRDKAKTAQTGSGDSTGAATAAKPCRKASRAAGALKPKTREDRKAEVKRVREEERRRKRELKRQERERRRRLKAAGSRSRSRGRGRSKGQYYVLKAVVSLGSDSYALVDGRRAGVGDVIMGRRIVAVGPDRIEVEAFGRRMTVHVGESLVPSSYAPNRRGR